MSTARTLIVGRMAVDTISNPYRQNVRVAGGSGLHAALASSALFRTALVSLTGRNFPQRVLDILKPRMDLSGVIVDPNRDCSEWIGQYDDLNRANTLGYTDNIPETAMDIPQQLRNSASVYLGAMHPSLQLQVLSQLEKPQVVMVDTIRGFLRRERELVTEVFKKATVVAVNREEAALFAGSEDMNVAVGKLMALGPKAVILKLGSEGALLATDNFIFKLPAYNADPLDTTGAGDSFGGAFTGYLAAQIEKGRILDNLAFGEAFLMGSIMASFTVEGFGSERLHSLTPQELLSRYLTARASLPLTKQLELEGKLNGNLLLDIFYRGSDASRETIEKLIGADYFPGSYNLKEAEGSLEIMDYDKCSRDKTQAIIRSAGTETEKVELTKRYLAELAKLDRSELSYFNLTEAILNLGRTAFADAPDPFAEPNARATELGREIARRLPSGLSPRAWLTILAAANALEFYSLKPKYLSRAETLRSIVEHPENSALELDATNLFEQKVMSRPTKLAWFTDNFGESEIDLKFILELAERYERMDPRGDWQIAIVPKALPTLTDSTHDSILSSIETENSPVAGLKKFIAEGKVKVLSGGSRTQGINLLTLSRQVADYLVEVKKAQGVVVGKGEAHLNTLSGLEIDTFLIFKAKSEHIALAAGIEQNALAAAYVPAGIKGIVGLTAGVRQNLKDVLQVMQAGPVPLDQVKARMLRTGEPFVDAAENLASSSEPMLSGAGAAKYVRPLLNDERIAGFTPIFIARASQPFKTAWDVLLEETPGAAKPSYPFMPKIGVVPRYSLAEMVAQLLTEKEAKKTIDSRTYKRLAAVFRELPQEIQMKIENDLGYPFSNLKGRNLRGAVLALGDLGIDEGCYQALELQEQLEGEKFNRQQDRDPALRAKLKRYYALAKGNLAHLTRPLLNVLLSGTGFGRFVRDNKVLFIDEAGSTGGTVISAELIVRAYYDKAVHKFYTVQPTKDTTGLYDGDCGIRFKPEEDQPKLSNLIFVKGRLSRTNNGLGQRLTYEQAIVQLAPARNQAQELAAYQKDLNAFLEKHYTEIFEGITHLNSLHAQAVLKLLLRRASSTDNALQPLILTIAEAVIKEELAPNHTKHRYAIPGELGLLEKRISELLAADPETRTALIKEDQAVGAYDSVQTLRRWQQAFERYREAVVNGARII